MDNYKRRKEQHSAHPSLEYALSNEFGLEPEFVADDPEVIQLILELSKKSIESFEPEAPKQQEISQAGTRSLKLRSRDGRIFCLSGVCLAKGDLLNNKIILSEPDFNTVVPKERSGGHVTVTANGQIINQTSSNPLGAYSYQNAQEKVKKTQVTNSFNNIAIQAWGRHAQNPHAAWIVYEIPQDSEKPTLMYENNRKRFLKSAFFLGKKVAELQQNELVHLEIHPGNWYLSESTPGKIVLTDWSTALDTNHLPDITPSQSDQVQHMFSELQPKEKAFALEIFLCLEQNAVEMTSRSLSEPEVLVEILVSFINGHKSHKPRKREAFNLALDHLLKRDNAQEKIKKQILEIAYGLAKQMYDDNPLPFKYSRETEQRLLPLAFREIIAKIAIELVKNNSIDFQKIEDQIKQRLYSWYTLK